MWSEWLLTGRLRKFARIPEPMDEPRDPMGSAGRKLQ
jgi:hypothetical protein